MLSSTALVVLPIFARVQRGHRERNRKERRTREGEGGCMFRRFAAVGGGVDV